MTCYEYRVVQAEIAKVGESSFEAHLNELGREGWKLDATLHRERHGFSQEVTLVFSRVARSPGG